MKEIRKGRKMEVKAAKRAAKAKAPLGQRVTKVADLSDFSISFIGFGLSVLRAPAPMLFL